jgi:hypothetical protein
VRLAVIGIDAKTVEFQAANPRASCSSSVTTRPPSAGHIFNGVEGENRRTAPAHMAAFVIGSGGMGGIFNHGNTVFLAQRANRIDIGRRAGVMNGNNGLCF